MVDRTSYSPYVDFIVVGLVLDEFRAEVERSPYPGTLDCHHTGNYLRYAHVSDFDSLLLFRQEDVQSLNVPVDNVLRVKVL